MIRIASGQLNVIGQEGEAERLNMVEFQQNLAEAFHRLGFKDSWMAQDISLTVEEKLRSEDAHLLSREDIDSLVVSLLNASGFQDVAREYAATCGNDPFSQERRNLKAWNDASINELLTKSLPLERGQVEQLSAKCGDILRACGLELAADSFIIGLSMHVLLNAAGDLPMQESVLSGHASAVKCNTVHDSEYSALAQELLKQGICRVLPYSSVFPRARVQLELGKLAEHFSIGWISQLTMTMPLNQIAPAILEIMVHIHTEIDKRYPHLTGTPLSFIICGIGKADMQNIVMPMLQECLFKNISFPCVTICHPN